MIRISKEHFDSEQDQEVGRLLRESEAALRPALRALPGLRAYYGGIDAAARAMTNASIRETRDQAMQMASLQVMRDVRTPFEALGVRSEDIANHEVLWAV